MTAPNDRHSHDEKPESRLGGILLGAVLLVFWCLAIDYMVDAYRQYQARAFTSVIGQMTSYVWDEFGTDGESELNVEYEYVVDGQKYLSQRKRFLYRAFSSGSDQAVQLAKSWGNSKPVRVFYDPQNPANAVLDNLFTPGDWKTLLAAIGVCLGTTALAVWYVMTRVMPLIRSRR